VQTGRGARGSARDRRGRYLSNPHWRETRWCGQRKSAHLRGEVGTSEAFHSDLPTLG